MPEINDELLNDREMIIKQLAHLDEGIHAMQQQLKEITGFIDEHKPALARGMALMDPASGLRKLVAGRKNHG